MTTSAAFTIVSNNYLAFAKVFAESYRRHHPEIPIFACIVDEPDAGVRYAEFPFECVFANELDIPAFYNFAFRYEIIELNTAVKPYMFAWLRDQHHFDRALYFDPDILIQDRLHGLEKSLASVDAVLTPHVAQPLDNDYHPTERRVRQAGVYNLGFLGLRLDERTVDFIDWWQDRLYDQCLVDLDKGLFVDQSWMDFAPAYLESVHIAREPIYNVAYWNLVHRHPELVDGDWRIGDRRVGFTHFSGIDITNLDAVSKHQNRLRLGDRPELRPLFEHYRTLLLDAGHDECRRLSYAYSTFRSTGVQVHPSLRQLLSRVDPNGRRWQDPFEIQCADSFFRWLAEPLQFAEGTLTRAVLALWESRLDLVEAFPRLGDRDLPRFIEWLRGGGAAEAGVDELFLRELRIDASGAASSNGAGRVLEPYDASTRDHAHAFLGRLDLSNPAGLARWLNEPVASSATGRPVITYLCLLLHRARTDLQHAFPDLCGVDRMGFAEWLLRYGVEEYDLHPDLVRSVVRSLPLRWRLRSRLHLGKRLFTSGADSALPSSAPATVPSPVPLNKLPEAPKRGMEAPRAFGVNLGAYFGMPTGVGGVGRASARVLEASGIPTARIPLDRDLSAAVSKGRIRHPGGCPFPVTLLHVNADQIPYVLSRLPTAITVKTYQIGYWFWELAHFPLVFADRFPMLDEVWAPTKFCQQAYEGIASVPVRHVAPYVPTPSPVVVDREKLGIDPDRFYFFFGFDAGSIPARKNPLATVEAFRRVHAELGEEVGLILKVSRPELAPALAGELHVAATKLPVKILPGTMSRYQMDELLASSDAFVSLHRSEGLGLLLIESLHLGIPVIATDYGGSADFLDAETGFPVGYEMTMLREARGPYPAGSVWAEPDVEHAAAQMRRVVEDREEARRRTERGRERVARLYGLRPAMSRFRNELKRVAGILDLEFEPVAVSEPVTPDTPYSIRLASGDPGA